MSRTNNSSRGITEDRLLRVPLLDLRPHPLNANSMSEERLEKLLANINAEGGRYPPLVVRTHPDGGSTYQLLDGHQRVEVLKRAGHHDALCFLWECDDATALRLVATLNQLPAKRAGLVNELVIIVPTDELAKFLPQNTVQIDDLVELFAVDANELLADFTAAFEESIKSVPRLISFSVTPGDEADIDVAVSRVVAGLKGSNRPGRSLGLIARWSLEGAHNG